jgi:predicted small metal-binding protein
MEATMTTKRWECLEPGCGFAVEADSDDVLVEKVREHMASAHDTFELEDMILDVATPVEGPRDE